LWTNRCGGEDWAGGTTEASLGRRIDRAAGELAEQMRQREPATVVDPFTLTTSFDQLLGVD
jgi:FMN reductase